MMYTAWGTPGGRQSGASAPQLDTILHTRGCDQVSCVSPRGQGAACMCHRTGTLRLNLRGGLPAFF